MISADGVSTDPGKVEVVANWPIPTSASELRSFLGFASYYRRFVEGFTKLVAPLHKAIAMCGSPKNGKKTNSFWSSLVPPLPRHVYVCWVKTGVEYEGRRPVGVWNCERAEGQASYHFSVPSFLVWLRPTVTIHAL